MKRSKIEIFEANFREEMERQKNLIGPKEDPFKAFESTPQPGLFHPLHVVESFAPKPADSHFLVTIDENPLTIAPEAA